MRLLVFSAAAVAAAALVGWALRNGRKRSSIPASRRILIEDALKQIHEAEYRGTLATAHGIAGALSIRSERAMALILDMEARGLVEARGESLHATEAGRDYARRVLRAHRLWERHLADETGVDQTAWHFEAERREHLLTPEETDRLAARLGHPRYDPHGDPIPTAAGVVPPASGRIPLNSLKTGQPARVVHIEDEPAAAYSRLSAEGLYAGLDLLVLETGPDHVRFLAEGIERSLPPALAAGVALEALAPGEAFDARTRWERLSQLALGEAAEVVSLSRACRGLERRRLMDLGVVPGTRIEAVMRSPSGDPTAYRIRGATIALRKPQADFIRVRRRAARLAS